MVMIPPGMQMPQGRGGNGSAPPKALMALLATLMLNQRLRQRSSGPQMPMPQQGMDQGRMADLARMRLGMGNGGGAPSGY
jgi:hypothetical protein